MLRTWRPVHRSILVLLVAYGALSVYATLAHLVGLPPMGRMSTHMLTLLAFSFALLHAGKTVGWGRTFLLMGLTFGISLTFESVGVATGLIFGPYHYTGSLGPRFLGLVPLLIPAAWFMMMYPAQIIAERLLGWRTPTRPRDIALLAGASAVVMTAWDLVMDPMMVRMGHWVWEVEGAYFGVPLQNYAGWLVTTFTAFAFYGWITQRIRPARLGTQPLGFERLAIWVYLITWASNSAAALQMGLLGPALAGAFSAGALCCLGLAVRPVWEREARGGRDGG